MEENNNTNKRVNNPIVGERIRERDSLTPSPEERAGYIYNLIKDQNNNITNWDLLCFCIEYLGVLAVIYPWLGLEEIKKMNVTTQEAHYFMDSVPETGIK